MGKYVIESKFENTRCFLEVACENREPYFFINRVDSLTPYAAPDLERVRMEAYEKGRKDVETQFCSYDACKNRQEEYQRGLSDAWDAARKLLFNKSSGGIGFNAKTIKEVFGVSDDFEVLRDYSASEAIEKIRQYEQEKEEIKVGDEVIPHHITADSTPVIVTRKWKDDYNQDAIHTIGYDGRTNCFLEEHVEKTGRHFEIAEILAKMKESANED